MKVVGWRWWGGGDGMEGDGSGWMEVGMEVVGWRSDGGGCMEVVGREWWDGGGMEVVR